MFSFSKKRRRQPPQPKHLSPPASPASFYSPGPNHLQQDPHPPPLPVEVSQGPAFPYATRFPWSPGSGRSEATSRSGEGAVGIQYALGTSASSKSAALGSPNSKLSAPLSSPEIQLDLDFAQEPLFENFPSMFDKRGSTPRPSSSKTALPPLKIPTPSPSPKPSPPSSRYKPTHIHAPGSVTPHAPSPASHSSHSSYSGSSTSSSFYSDSYSYIWTPSFTRNVSSPRRRSVSPHRLTRQDSATLPMEPELFRALRRKSSDAAVRNKNSDSALRRKSSVSGKSVDKRRSHSRHSRRASRKSVGSMGAGAGGLTPLEPMPKDALERVSGISSVPGSARVSAAGPNSAGPSPATGRSGTSLNGGMSPPGTGKSTSSPGTGKSAGSSSGAPNGISATSANIGREGSRSRSHSRSRSRSRNRKSHRAPPPEIPSSPVPSLMPLSPTGSTFSPTNTNAFSPMNVNAKGIDSAARGNGFGQFGQFVSQTTRSPPNEFPLSPTIGSPMDTLPPTQSQTQSQRYRERRVSRISEGSSVGTGSPAKRKYPSDESPQDTRLERHAYGEYDDGGDDGSDGVLLMGDVLDDYLGLGSGVGEYMTDSAGYAPGFASPSLHKKDAYPDSLDEKLPYLNKDYDISPSQPLSSPALQRDMVAPRPPPRDPSPRLPRDPSQGAPPRENETAPDVSPKQSEGTVSPRPPARVLPPRTVSKQGVPRPLPPSPSIPLDQLDGRDQTRQAMSPEPRPLPPSPPQVASEKDSPPLHGDAHRSPPLRLPPSPPVNAHTSGPASQLHRTLVHAGMQFSEVSSSRDTHGSNLPVGAGPSGTSAPTLPNTPGSRPTPSPGAASFRPPPGTPGSRQTPSPGAPNTPLSRPSPSPRPIPSPGPGGPATPMSRPTPGTGASMFPRGALSPGPVASSSPRPTLSPGEPVTPSSRPSPARSMPNTPALRPTPSPTPSPALRLTPSPNLTPTTKHSPAPMPPSRLTPSPDPGRPSPYSTGTGSNAVRTPSPSRSAQWQGGQGDGRQAAQHPNQLPSQHPSQSQNPSQYQHPPSSQSQLYQQHSQPSQPHLQPQSHSQQQVPHSHPSAQSHNPQRRSASSPDTRTPDADTESMRSASSSATSSVKAKGQGWLDGVPEKEVRNGESRSQGIHLPTGAWDAWRNHSAGDVSETSSGSHGAGVRRISSSAVGPSARRQSAARLPIGKVPPAFERLKLRERSGSESALTSPVHDARRLRASQFPETPHDSPFLTPSSDAALSRATSNATAQAPAGYDVAVPPRSNMPKPPLMDPAPRRPRRGERPLGPRPSVRGAQSRLSHSTSAPPSSPRFEAEPVRWRGLTMDAATWTFTSGQLQDVVGRAIRQSAEPSSIRLLTLDVIDNELQPEVTRLEALREELKTQYRQAMKRRHAVQREGGGRLAQELVELAGTCDQISEELVRVMDELQQINRLRDVHSASALAMALRKLNSSFMKQSADAGELRTRCAQLEAERDEAWAMAERVERDLLDMQARMDTALAAGALSTPSASNRSSRVSAARTTSVRASRASLRFSRAAARNSHSSTTSSNHLSSAPPVPPMPRLTYSQTLSLNTDLPSASLGTPHSMGMSSGLGHSPSSETRELVQVQNELYTMLGLTRADLRRTRSGRQPPLRRPASEVMSPSSMPTSPFLANSGLITRPTSDVASPQVLARRRNASFSHPRPDAVYFGLPEEI